MCVCVCVCVCVYLFITVNSNLFNKHKRHLVNFFFEKEENLEECDKKVAFPTSYFKLHLTIKKWNLTKYF